MKTKISVNIETAAPEPRKEYRRPSLEEKVDEYIRLVDSKEDDSVYEWNYLKRLYEKLVCYPPKEVGDILRKLEDLFEKYGNKDSHGAVQMDAQTMNNYDYEDED